MSGGMGYVKVSDMSDDTLDKLAADLRAENPSLTFVVDAGAVWLRDGGTDYGMYSRAISGEIVRVSENGRTVVTRTTPDDDTKGR